MRATGQKTAQPGPRGPAVRMPGGHLVTRRVGSERTGGAYALFEVEVGPRGGEPPHVQHRDDECVCVVEGRFEVLIEDERFEAGPGGVIYVPKGALHAYENVGEGVGRMLTIHTPGATHERFVEAAGEPANGSGAPRAPEPRPHADGLVLLAAEHGVEVCEPTTEPTTSGKEPGQ